MNKILTKFKMSEKKQYPNPEQVKGEMEQYLSGPEAEKNEKDLSDALTAKAKLEELGIPVPAQLQTQIDELQAKNPINQLPKWASKTEWVKVLQERKEKLEAAVQGLGDIKPAMREELQAELARIDAKLEEPKEELGGLSRAKYAKKVTKVLGLEDATEPKPEKTLTPEQKEQILATLEKRFKENERLHEGVEWDKVKAALEANEKVLWSINEMEKAGHRPDVYNADDKGFDVGTCSKESPEKQRNCTFPESQEMGKAIGIPHMTRTQYKDFLQSKGIFFDTDSGSWLDADTPDEKADLSRSGDALCGVRDVDAVRVARDDAASRTVNVGWRGSLRVLWKKS